MSTYTNVPWMTVDDHGATTGNGYLTHTCAGGYKGRLDREGYTTVTTDTTPELTAKVRFVQLGNPEYLSFDGSGSGVASTGGSVTITGKTNSSSLAFALTTNQGTMASLASTFSITVDGTTTSGQTSSGQTFVGDPGAENEIAFTILVSIAANTSMTTRRCVLTVTSASGLTDTYEMIQLGGESYINLTSSHLSSTTVTFSANGQSGGSTSVDVDINSNDDWNLEE